jgi:hypothetical protein
MDRGRHATFDKIAVVYEHIQKMVAKTGISVLDAFRLQMQPDRLLPGLTAPDGLIVTQGDWLQTHLLRLAPNQAQQSVDPGQDFHARLRPYQQIGLNWLAEMDRLKLGRVWRMTWGSANHSSHRAIKCSPLAMDRGSESTDAADHASHLDGQLGE